MAWLPDGTALPGRLFIVEGIDGSGKSTQLDLLHKWLVSEGYLVVFTEWNSSPLVRRTTQRGKRDRLLTPLTFSLIHAADLADRMERQVIPALKAGAIVLADRYIYTAFARDGARGIVSSWVRKMYGFAVRPTVAKPHLPSNTVPADGLADVKIDQVVIGSCTNGRLADLQQAAGILRGKKVHPDVRCIILPGTQQVCLDAIADGTMQALVEAGRAFSTPTCGACLGGHMGVLAAGERAVATTNRNFVGRMGHPESEVYLSNPYVAAASAIAGHVATPDMVAAGKGGAR